jgi:hypothetical protein
MTAPRAICKVRHGYYEVRRAGRTIGTVTPTDEGGVTYRSSDGCRFGWTGTRQQAVAKLVEHDDHTHGGDQP